MLGFVLLLPLLGVPAAGQEEAAQVQEQAAGVPGRVQYSKGRSPGSNNNYLARYDEDYAYLADPAKRDRPLDPLKFIPFDQARRVYLTLNGEIRSRNDFTQHRNFNVSQLWPAPPAGSSLRPAFVAPTSGNENQLFKQRYELGADLHLGEHFRLYAELWHAQQTARQNGPVVPASQRNALSAPNAFGEYRTTIGATRLGLRAGRQEIFFGNTMQVGANVATNLPDPVFDGVRAYADWGSGRVDAFAFNASRYNDGILDDQDIAHRNLWGVYGSFDLPPMQVLGTAARTSLDLFYFGFRARPNSNGAGTGLYDDAALVVASAAVSPAGGFRPAQDLRHTVGLRIYGEIGAVDFDWNAALQRGQYGGLDVQAWAFNTDTGYTFRGTPWRPRLGLHVDGASGGASTTSRIMGTYQPLFPNTLYFLPNSFFAPTNFYDVSPRLRLKPFGSVTIDAYYELIWRYTSSDAVYNGNWKGANGTNAYALTGLVRGDFVGRAPDLTIGWTPVPYVVLRADFLEFIPGSALKAVGARDTSYVNVTATFKF